MGTVELSSLNNLELTRFFLVLVLLLASSHLFGHLFHILKLPRAVGEIFGGFVLGPTVVGFLSPGMYQWLFCAFAEEGKLLSIFYWLGLILLMFISGFEIQKSFNREDRKTILAILLGSTLIPFTAGFLLPLAAGSSSFAGIKSNLPALQIIIGIAVAITSIPVIAKIFIDLDIIATRFAKIVLTTAIFHDIILWVALAIATGIVNSETMSPFNVARTVCITLLFLGAAITAIPKVLIFCNSSKYNVFMANSVPGYILIICFLCVSLASILNVNIAFGAFVAGIIIGFMRDEKFEKGKVFIKEVALSFFIPLYFAIVGLKIDLIHHFNAASFLFFLVFATICSVLGTMLSARMAGRDWGTSFNLSVAMNARGILGVVLASVALDLGIINETFFVTLVLVSILTTVFAGYWFRYSVSKGRELYKEI